MPTHPTPPPRTPDPAEAAVCDAAGCEEPQTVAGTYGIPGSSAGNREAVTYCTRCAVAMHDAGLFEPAAAVQLPNLVTYLRARVGVTSLFLHGTIADPWDTAGPDETTVVAVPA